MKKTERLNGIIFTLKEHGKMTAHELAEHFEVNVRTIYRDVDALSQLKVPIITYDGVHGGYEIDMDYFIPSIKLTEQEVIMLMMVLKFGESIKLPNLTADYQMLKGKVINTLADVDQQKVQQLMQHVHFSSSRLEPQGYSKGLLHPVLESFIETCNLDITYYNPRRDTCDVRHISPTSLFFEEGGWYLNAFCHLRQEKRCFRLDRIKDIELSAEKNLYMHREISSSTDKFKREVYELSIESDLFRVLKDNDYFSHIELLNDRDNPLLRLRVDTPYEEELTKVVLSNPGAITIESPTYYVEKIKRITQTLYNKYL